MAAAGKYNGHFLRVKNLDRYQHYKDRNPPWIKLHQELLEDYDFGCLQDASKAHALCIMLLASRLDNRLPADAAWIGRRINATSEVDLDVLLNVSFLELVAGCGQVASGSLSSCEQVATLEREGETEGETEGEEEKEPSVVSRRETVSARGETGKKDPGAAPPCAMWAQRAKRPSGVTPRILEAVVIRTLREIRQAPVEAARCATAAKEVLSLWRAIGAPSDVHRFAEDLVLVARAAQMSADRIFARDIRAEGWPEGVDRTFQVTTLCRHDRWDDRLRAAQTWGQGSGRLGLAGVALAKRARWMDPGAPKSWRGLEEQETLHAVYLRCAKGLFEQELAGPDLDDALLKLGELAERQGSSADLTEVVRLAVDRVGAW